MSSKSMTLGELKARLAKVPDVFDDYQVKVWLPGSTISLTWMGHYQGKVLHLEGNIDEGSILCP